MTTTDLRSITAEIAAIPARIEGLLRNDPDADIDEEIAEEIEEFGLYDGLAEPIRAQALHFHRIALLAAHLLDRAVAARNAADGTDQACAAAAAQRAALVETLGEEEVRRQEDANWRARMDRWGGAEVRRGDLAPAE